MTTLANGTTVRHASPMPSAMKPATKIATNMPKTHSVIGCVAGAWLVR